MGNHAKFNIKTIEPLFVIIEDVGPWEQYPTVTNDAEFVVQQMIATLGDRRLFYIDSDGDESELVIKNGKFDSFSRETHEDCREAGLLNGGYSVEPFGNGTVYTISPHMVAAIRQYVDHGGEVGHFLRAVIANDLKEAFARADNENCPNMFAFVDYFYNHTPSVCWGSKQAYTDWIEKKRKERDV